MWWWMRKIRMGMAAASSDHRTPATNFCVLLLSCIACSEPIPSNPSSRFAVLYMEIRLIRKSVVAKRFGVSSKTIDRFVACILDFPAPRKIRKHHIFGESEIDEYLVRLTRR